MEAPNTEGFLEIGGEERPIKTSNKAVRSICQRAGERYLPYLDMFLQRRAGIDDVALVLHEALKAGGGKDITFDQVLDWMDAEGFDHWLGQAVSILTRIMKLGNPDAPGESA